jgi:hypothetical protein
MARNHLNSFRAFAKGAEAGTRFSGMGSAAGLPGEGTHQMRPGYTRQIMDRKEILINFCYLQQVSFITMLNIKDTLLNKAYVSFSNSQRL